jgi:Fe-S oxidoreductase
MTKVPWTRPYSAAWASVRAVKRMQARCARATRSFEEKHTIRARSHLLWEMLQGQIIKGGWEDDEVKESLDLCLACKVCNGECPVNVDVATYKAEFLNHYYALTRDRSTTAHLAGTNGRAWPPSYRRLSIP